MLEESARGVYVAARSPDFREMIRTRYVGLWAQLSGLLLSFGAFALAAGPVIWYYSYYGSVDPEPVLASFVALLVIFAMEWKLAKRQLGKLLQNIKT